MKPTLVHSDDDSEFWTLGKALFVGVPIRPEYSPRLRRALERRRDASLTGRCQCGAFVPGWPRPGRYAVFKHESNCDAGDERLGPLLTAEQPAALARN